MNKTTTFHILSLLLVLNIVSLTLFAQHPTDSLNQNNINLPYINHLIKKEIDQYRKSIGLNELHNDSILFVASRWHSSYLKPKKSISHFEPNNPKKKSPHLRVRHFGGKYISIGENIVRIPVGKLVSTPKTGKLPVFTYAQAAQAMRILWLASPQHLANIRTSNYSITGVSTSYNQKKQELTCVQKFAEVSSLYQPKKWSSMFKYNNQIVSNFTPQIPKYLEHKKHAYKVKTDKKGKICNARRTDIFNFQSIKIEVFNDSVYLQIRERELSRIKKYFQHTKDGIALEVVLFKYNYSCNPIDNYIVPTRRNGGCMFDGYVTPPLYKKAILDSIKKSELELDLSGANRRPNSFIQINLGAFPQQAIGERVNGNLLVLTKNRICKIISGVTLCGSQYYSPCPKLPLIADFSPGSYKPTGLKKIEKFKVPFEQNSLAFDTTRIKEIIRNMNFDGYEVKKAVLNAFASVEGKPETNQRLFEKRAKAILKVFEDNQSHKIDFSIKTEENWKMFYRQIKSTNWKYLKNLDTNRVRQIINNPDTAALLEPLFSKQRYVTVKVLLYPIITEENKIDYALQEFDSLKINLEKKWNRKTVERMLSIQNLIYTEHLKGNQIQLDKMPYSNENNLLYNRLLFENIVKGSDYANSLIDIKLKGFYKQKLKLPYLKENYMSYYLNLDYIDYKTKVNFINELQEHIKSKYPEKLDSINRFRDHCLLNEHYRYLNPRYSKKIQTIKENLHNYYNNNDSLWNDDFRFTLAKYFIYINENEWAMDILKKLALKENYNPNHYAQYVKTYYFLQSTHSKYKDYKQVIMDAENKLSNAQWCNLFIGGCNISLPIFDDPVIKNMYCLKCREEEKKLQLK